MYEITMNTNDSCLITIVCQNLHHAYLLEVGLMQMLVEYETSSIECHVGIHVDYSPMIIYLGP